MARIKNLIEKSDSLGVISDETSTVAIYTFAVFERTGN